MLRCCEHLVTALGWPDTGPVRVDTDAALVEALWTGALIGYVRCFSGRSDVLTDADLPSSSSTATSRVPRHGQEAARPLRVAAHQPARGVHDRRRPGQRRRPNGVAVVSTPRPLVDDTTVRLLGRVAYALSGLVDARMQKAQNRVLGAAGQ